MANDEHLEEIIARDVDATIESMLKFRDNQLPRVMAAATALISALASGHKILIFGNGGSAAQAQHMAAELVNRFLSNTRPPLPAIALTTDSSVLTSIANDRSYEELFSVQIRALGQPGDVALGISTSGNSGNVNHALRLARSMGLVTVGLNGKSGGAMKELLDVEIRISTGGTPQIQEVQDVVIHALCHVIDVHFDQPNEVLP